MTGKIMPLRERDTSTVQARPDAFLSSPRYANQNTRRGYNGRAGPACWPGSGPAARWPGSAGRSWPGCWSSSGGSGAPATWNRDRGAVRLCACPGARPERLPDPVLPASAER